MKKNKRKAKYQISRVITSIWELLYGVWIARNEDRHGHDDSEKAKRQREQVEREENTRRR